MTALQVVQVLLLFLLSGTVRRCFRHVLSWCILESLNPELFPSSTQIKIINIYLLAISPSPAWVGLPQTGRNVDSKKNTAQQQLYSLNVTIEYYIIFGNLKPWWKHGLSLWFLPYNLSNLFTLFTSGFTIRLQGGSDWTQTYITADKLRCEWNQERTEDPFGRSYRPPPVVKATFVSIKFWVWLGTAHKV